MKRLYQFLPILACIALLTGCRKDYLETQPTDSVAETEVFTTTANALAALNGIHRSMFMGYNTQGEAGEGSMNINRDMLGEDLVMTAQGNGWYNNAYRWIDHRNANSDLVYFAYQFYYKVIANANMILKSIDTVTGTEADKEYVKGQALAYRGWAHFQLVQLYGKRYNAAAQPNSQPGVPIMLSVTTEGQPRATVEEVYTQVNKDLTEAAALLKTARNRTAKSHINYAVVRGIQARVALTMQDWPTAAAAAREARTASGISLMSNADYVAGFNKTTNPEWMWGSTQVDDQTTYFASFFAYLSSNFNSTNIRTNPKAINSQLYRTIPATDVRKQVWDSLGTTIVIPPGGIRARYGNKKFLAQSSSSSVGDIVYMRAAEMYLIEAEALARQGKEAEAADVLHILNLNRNPRALKVSSTGDALLAEIWRQRRVELWGEGFRFTDLKRLNQPLNRNGANHNVALAVVMEIPAGDVRWEFLIPQREINANKAVVQNPL